MFNPTCTIFLSYHVEAISSPLVFYSRLQTDESSLLIALPVSRQPI